MKPKIDLEQLKKSIVEAQSSMSYDEDYDDPTIFWETRSFARRELIKSVPDLIELIEEAKAIIENYKDHKENDREDKELFAFIGIEKCEEWLNKFKDSKKKEGEK